MLTIARPALHGTDPAGATATDADEGYRGTGFYRLQYPQSPVAEPPADVRPRLQGMAQPTLILKGGRDYLSWTSATTYRRTLPNAVLAYYPQAGHNLYQDRPRQAREEIRAFLTDAALPAPPCPTLGVPPVTRARRRRTRMPGQIVRSAFSRCAGPSPRCARPPDERPARPHR